MIYKGIVSKGVRSGTRLGFPTVNIFLNDSNVSGIYVGTVLWEGEMYPSAIYANQKRNILEAHMIDFSGNLYAQEISITLLKKIRDDVAFTDETTLIKQIAEDVQQVKEYFAGDTLEV